MKQRLLIIDGMYFCQRVLAQCNMQNAVNNLETEIEQRQFKVALNTSLINLWKSFSANNLIDQMIYVTDNGSWRKTIKPFKPYYVGDEVSVGYKDNRKAKKEESSVNYDNFYRLANEFATKLDEEKIIPVFNIHQLEGDDNLMLLAHKLGSNHDTFSIIFATDGDLEQIVRQNVVMFKNIRSKQAPFGEFIIDINTYSIIFENTTISSLLKNNIIRAYLINLMRITANDTTGQQKTVRGLNAGISVAKPFKTALTKIICGDKKDNIFSLAGWKSTTGTRNYSLTEKHLEKGLEALGYSYTEKTAKDIFNGDIDLSQVLNATLMAAKQSLTELTSIMEHFKHNLRLKILKPSCIPDDLREQFETKFEEQKISILTGTPDLTKLNKLDCSYIDEGINIFEESIPELNI